MMKRFLVIAEVKIDDLKYSEVNQWGVEPTDYVTSILCDHARDRGLIIKARAIETDYKIYDQVNESVEVIQKDMILNQIETEILANTCINGNCED